MPALDRTAMGSAPGTNDLAVSGYRLFALCSDKWTVGTLSSLKASKKSSTVEMRRGIVHVAMDSGRACLDDVRSPALGVQVRVESTASSCGP